MSFTFTSSSNDNMEECEIRYQMHDVELDNMCNFNYGSIGNFSSAKELTFVIIVKKV